MAKRELDELKSALTELTATIQAQAGLSSDAVAAKTEEIEASRKAAEADNEEARASKAAASSVGSAFMKLAGSTIGTINAFYGLSKVIASIGEAGRKYAEQVGTTASQGAQFQLDLIRTLKADTKRFATDQKLTAEQIRGAAQSYAEVFVGAAEGMQISAEGAAEFARNLKGGFKSEFQLTSQSMKALITAGLGTRQEFERFRKATGLAGISSNQFANLVNKNSLSFMLYGPNFAKAAINAERLGISLAAVQKAQESMVTNLDGTIDTVAQINQLGGQIDFGALTTIAETQGPEAVLSYLQSTIPPALFQSASTRALLSGLGVPLEDLMKRQGSTQESAATKIEKALTDVAGPASKAAQNLADLNFRIKAIDESKVMELMNAAYGAATALIGLIGALGGFAIALFKASMNLLKFPMSPTTGPTGTASKLLDLDGNPIKGPGMLARMKGYATSAPGRLSDFVQGIPGRIAGIPGALRSAAAARFGGGLSTSFGRMGAFGVGAGILSTGMAGADAYRSALASGKGRATAAGEASIAGGSAVAGTILGGFFGPAGAVIGGQMGAMFGKKINEWFPGLGKSIGETFSKIKEAATPVLASLKDLWNTMKGPLLTSLKIVGAILGGTLMIGFKALGFVFSVFIAPTVRLISTLLKGMIGMTVGLFNAIIKGLNNFSFLFGGKTIPSIPVPAGEGGAVATGGTATAGAPAAAPTAIPKPIATQVAETMKTAVTDTAARMVAQGDPELKRAIVDLTKIIKDSQTEIKVDNKVVQVSRLGLKTVSVDTRSA